MRGRVPLLHSFFFGLPTRPWPKVRSLTRRSRLRSVADHSRTARPRRIRSAGAWTRPVRIQCRRVRKPIWTAWAAAAVGSGGCTRQINADIGLTCQVLFRYARRAEKPRGPGSRPRPRLRNFMNRVKRRARRGKKQAQKNSRGPKRRHDHPKKRAPARKSARKHASGPQPLEISPGILEKLGNTLKRVIPVSDALYAEARNPLEKLGNTLKRVIVVSDAAYAEAHAQNVLSGPHPAVDMESGAI